MNRAILIALAIFLALPALAEETLEDMNLSTFSKTSPYNTNEYMKYRIGDHFEWTLYGADYHRPDYGHRYEWTNTGLGVMSVCEEVDSETGGERYRLLADDGHCPQYEAEYHWYIPFEGQLSRCVKVDKLTGGRRFSRIVDDGRCAKPDTVFAWEKKFETAEPECMELDGETSGKHYRRAAKNYLCAKTLNVQVAYGRKVPDLPKASPSCAPASVSPTVRDKTYWEDPEDMLEHVHRRLDKIHQR